jgi:hypothetical protein
VPAPAASGWPSPIRDWRLDKLARQFERLGHAPESSWCYGGYQLVDRSGRPVAKAAGGPWHPFEGWIAERLLTTEAAATIQTLLVRSDLAKELQFDPRIPLSEDYDFVLRLAVRAPGCAVAAILAEVLVHERRTTAISGSYTGHLGPSPTARRPPGSLIPVCGASRAASCVSTSRR